MEGGLPYCVGQGPCNRETMFSFGEVWVVKLEFVWICCRILWQKGRIFISPNYYIVSLIIGLTLYMLVLVGVVIKDCLDNFIIVLGWK